MSCRVDVVVLEIGWNWPGASAARLLLSVIVNVCLAVVVVLQLHGHDGQGQGWPNVVEVCGKGSCRGCAAPRTCAAPSGLLYGMQCSVEAHDCCVCTVDLCVQALGGASCTHTSIVCTPVVRCRLCAAGRPVVHGAGLALAAAGGATAVRRGMHAQPCGVDMHARPRFSA